MSFVDTETFDEIAYRYRSWPGSDPKGVLERFEELKEYIRLQVGTPRHRARTTDPDTSHIAARERRGRRSRQIVEILRKEGPSTMHHVAEKMGIAVERISPQFRPLARSGQIFDTGARESGPLGYPRILWSAA